MTDKTYKHIFRSLRTEVRQFGRQPIEPHIRFFWEFYVLVEGRCGVLLDGWEKLPIKRSTLWVFPPGHRHGWHGDLDSCTIVALSADSVPEALSWAVPVGGFLECELTEEECGRVLEMGGSAEGAVDIQNPINVLRFDRALMDLTLLALNDSSLVGNLPEETRVNAAMGWLRRIIRERSVLDDVAAAMRVAPGNSCSAC